MDCLRTLSELKDHPLRAAGTAVALGMFDGVHVGHRMVLDAALRQARETGASPVVLSFANHPQTLLARTPTALLSTLDERLAQFEALGFQAAVMLDFTDAIQQLSATEFVSEILVAGLNIRAVAVGYDHRFGRHRQGDGELLRRLGDQHGFSVTILDPVRVPDADGTAQVVSSTLIRKLLAYGDIPTANRLLGRAYALAGVVESGVQRGQQLGFPTANLSVPEHRLVPAVGTYAGTATLGAAAFPAVCNIGVSPTFGDQTRPRVEVHLLGYDGPSFYGETLTMTFLARLRDERAFPSADALIHQIQADCDQARALCPPLLSSDAP